MGDNDLDANLPQNESEELNSISDAEEDIANEAEPILTEASNLDETNSQHELEESTRKVKELNQKVENTLNNEAISTPSQSQQNSTRERLGNAFKKSFSKEDLYDRPLEPKDSELPNMKFKKDLDEAIEALFENLGKLPLAGIRVAGYLDAKKQPELNYDSASEKASVTAKSGDEPVINYQGNDHEIRLQLNKDIEKLKNELSEFKDDGVDASEHAWLNVSKGYTPEADLEKKKHNSPRPEPEQSKTDLEVEERSSIGNHRENKPSMRPK